uniref:Activin_recp domain-containing protein n=1 Tax=Caenorhabditis tropicalis TaxID=1561998 RepID=A0A1I7TCG6_9PELO
MGVSEAVRCFDCVGMDCMGSFCEGEYCMVSQYAPRWGSARWGEPEVVKGCAKGSMLGKDVRSHCEFAEDSDEPFTCFCNGKDLCNSRKSIRKVEREDVELVQCVCNGAHCKNDKTCIGELCTYVVNHKTKQVEQGCTNASVPLIERRAIGSCMAPPITGAMHHNVAKDAQSLLAVESCICGTDYCNSEKPSVTVPENESCSAYVEVTTMGTTTKSKNISCTGEYCFTASIKSKLGIMSSYRTYGCASFTGEDPLPEELDPTGCATFTSENLEVKTCYKTSDKNAVGRALASKQIPESRQSKPSKGKAQKPKPKQVEVEYDNEEEEEEEEEKPKGKSPKNRQKATAEAKKEEAKEEEEEEEEEEEKEKEKEVEASTKKSFIFQKPTQPPIPDDSNTTMITVFVLIILCILGSGIVWKFELHKKLKRSNYDSVAGG